MSKDNKLEIKQSTEQELVDKAEGFRRELFQLRLNATTAHVKDYSQFKKVRKKLARALTYLQQKRAGTSGITSEGGS